MSRKSDPMTGALPLKLAYVALLDDRPLCARIGMARQTISNQRYRVAQGLFPSREKMRQRLFKAGWKLAVEEHWAPSATMLARGPVQETAPAFKWLAPRFDAKLALRVERTPGAKRVVPNAKTRKAARSRRKR
jgi:hypothetical protein